MPSYDYRCPTNGQTFEVRHGMSENINTWGELCERAGVDLGSTPSDAPVERLITGGNFVSSGALKNPEPACGSGGCASGMCGLN